MPNNCQRDKKIYKLVNNVTSLGCEIDDQYAIPKTKTSHTLVGDILFDGEKRGIRVIIIKLLSSAFIVGDVPVIEEYKNKKTIHTKLAPIIRVHVVGSLHRIEI